MKSTGAGRSSRRSFGRVAGARLGVVEANRRGSDCPEHVSVAGNWEPQDLSDMGSVTQ